MDLDREKLLAPVSPEEPSGPWLRRDPVYAEIQEAMRAEAGDPDYGIPEKKADWHETRDICNSALADKTRDFYVATCLLEALARTDGVSGLENGLWVLGTLHEHFWADFHPRPRDEGTNFDGRLNQLEAFIRTFPRVLDALPAGDERYGMTLFDWNHAGGKLPGGLDSPFGEDQKAEIANGTSWDYFDGAVTGMNRCKEQLTRLDALLDTCYTDNAPSLRDLFEELETKTSVYEGLLRDKGPSPHEEQAREVLNQTGCDFIDAAWLAEHFKGGLSLSRAINSVGAATGDARQGVQPDNGWPALLEEHWGRGDTYERTTTDPEPVAPPPGATPAPASAPAGGGPAVPVAVSGEGLGQLLGSANLLRAQDPGNALGFVVPRLHSWAELEGKDSETVAEMPSPASGLRAKLAGLFEKEACADLLEASENAILQPGGGAWLDLQRYSCAAMGQIGQPYGPARREVLRQLSGMMGRYPWLLGAQLGDGEPSADEITQNWIASEAPAARPGGGGSGPSEPADENLTRAESLLSSDGLEAAVAFLQTAARSAPSDRARARLRRDLAELCLGAERPELAAPVLEGLRDELNSRANGWEDPAFVGSVLEALHKSYTLLAVSAPSEEVDAKRRSVADDLARVDLERRLRLE
ncbi:MAG: type VI secretion system domain-containing protein [Planctomycetota bacterium]